MEESFSRRHILTPAELRALNKKSDFAGFFQLISHFMSIFMVGLIHYYLLGSWWCLLSGFVLGVLINFLYAGQHELSHSTVFKTTFINEFFGRIIGFFMFFPRDFDQIMHFAHHKFTQNWEKDGELAREPFTLKSYLFWLSGITYWKNRWVGILRRGLGKIIEPYIFKSQERRVILESQIHLLGYATIVILSFYFETLLAVYFWILPMVLTKPIHQLQNTIEHLGLSHEDDILKNTRSTRTNFFFRWLCWQMPYHTAHHTFPSVPFWKLKHVNKKVEEVSGPVHSMGWLEFQFSVISRLLEKDESRWPQNEVWVVSNKDNKKNIKLEA